MNRIFLTICIALASVFASWAQTATVTGTVIDEEGPLIGASVLVKGTSNGTATDFDGNFELKDVDVKNAELVFSYVGYMNKTVKLDGRTSGIEVFMEANTQLMEEVVVIGYGTMKRANVAGAMTSVDAQAIERLPVANVGEAIIGRMPGVQVTTADGSPDAEITVRIRGGGSITQSNQPLVLIDGFEGSLNDVPPTDIEDIQVLKDAAATAIYGARGANGVVLVTTKKPQDGKVSVNVNAYVKTSELSHKMDVLTPYEFIRANWDRNAPKGSSQRTSFGNTFGQPYEFYIYQGYAGTDWQDVIFGTHPISSAVDANINGGNDRFKFKLSYMHQEQPSVMPENGLTQNNVNLTMNLKLWDFLSVEYRTRYMNKTLRGRGTEGISLLDAMLEQPTYGLQDFTQLPDNNLIIDESNFSESYHYDPLETNRRFYRNRYSWLLNMGGALNWTIIKGMTIRNEFVYEDFSERNRIFNAAESNSDSRTVGPHLKQTDKTRNRWQLTNTWNYTFRLNDVHDIAVMLGQEMKHEQTKQKYNYIGYFPDNIDAEKAFDNYALGTVISATSSSPSPIRTLSFFGRANYSFDDRYIATFTLRADGSSKFAKENRWGYFPAGALAWRISNENFMRDVTWISELKLRASLGMSGNDRIDSDLYLNLYKLGDISKAAGWGEKGNYYYEMASKYPVNPNVKWETTITRNIGFDFTVLNGKIDGSVDAYWNTTKDLLLETVIPGDTGFEKMMTNVGQTSNRGIELNLNAWVFENKDWTVGLNMNIGFNRGKIDKLNRDELSFYATADKIDVNDDVFWYTVGESMGTILGYVNDGIYTVDDFDIVKDGNHYAYNLKPGIVDCSLLTGTPQPGYPKYKKLSDNPDDPNRYILTTDDRQILGKTTPDFSGGFGANVKFRDFDLAAQFNFMVGFDVLNTNRMKLSLVPATGTYQNLDGAFRNMWFAYDENGNNMKADDPATYAEYNKNATMWNPSNMTKTFVSSYYVEDGSFLRLQNLTLGYTIPERITKKIGMNRCRFYATGYNLFTFTGYQGYDPEVNIGEGIAPNQDYNMYPRSRSYSLGVQLTF